MGLDRRAVEDVPPDVHLRDLDALGKDLVQLEQRRLEAMDRPLDIRQRREAEAVALQHGPPLVGAAALDRVRDHRLVLDGMEALRIVAVGEECGRDAVDLPGLAGAGREVLRPRQVELEDEVLVATETDEA